MKFHKLKLPKWYIAITLVWTLLILLMMSVSAATSGSGDIADSKFLWSWETTNTNTGAAGDFKGSLSENTLTLEISANSSTFKAGSCGSSDTPANSTTNNATITNNTGSTIQITSVRPTNVICSLHVNDQVAHGKGFTVSITAEPLNESDATSRPNSGSVEITYTVVENVNVTYYGADGASYTYGGVSLTSAATSKTVLAVAGSRITLPAAPTVTSGTFAGWRIGHTGECLAAGGTFTADEDTSVYPVIVADGLVAPFSVDGTAYEFWTDAVVATGGNGTIVLNQDYTLPTTLEANGVSPAGGAFVSGTDGDINYIVPTGVTLLIPYDIANTLCTTSPTFDGEKGYEIFGTQIAASANGWVKPTAYLTLKMVQGSNITVETGGAISISGKVCGYQVSNACPTGPLGFIEMEADSSITINSGGFLYAWGYITGSGSVTIKSGGTVYENFQLKDWRGGTAAKGMVGTDERVFPSSQYYVQNVEVPMHFEAGALEFGYMCLVASSVFGEATVPFIGGSGMFQNKGTITKDYLEDTDRLMVEVEGYLTMSNLNLAISGIAMNSSDYVLPITNNLSVIVKSGTTTIGQDMCMLPGSVITVAEGATVALAEGVNFFLYDADEWVDKSYVYSSRDVSPLAYVGANKGAPVARAALDDAKIIVNGTVDASLGYAYTTASGGNVTSTGSGTVIIGKIGSKTTTYQATQSNTSISYSGISITSAQLKNANPSKTYTETATEGAGTYYYCLNCGMWLTDNTHSHTGWLTNVSLSNNLHMYFAYQTDLEAGNLTASVTHYYADGSVVTTDGYTLEQGTINGNQYLRLTYTGVAAKEMVDAVYVTLYDSTGKAVAFWGDSIEAYALRLYDLGTTSDKLKTVIVNMLNYGAACQDFFNYNETHFANANLTSEQLNKASADKNYGTATSPDSEAWKNSQLVVDSDIRFRIAFTDKVTKEMYVSYSFIGHKGNSVASTGKIPITEQVEIDGVMYYCMMIDGLVVADAAHMYDENTDFFIEVKVYAKENDATPVYSFTDSLKDYATRLQDTDVVYKMFMRFSESSHYYLHSRGGTQ